MIFGLNEKKNNTVSWCVLHATLCIIITNCSLFANNSKDTTFHPQSGRVFTITEKKNNLITQFTQCYIDGSQNYRIEHEYDSNSKPWKNTYYDSNNKKYEYGTYTINENIVEYSHFTSDNTKLYKILFDPSGKKTKEIIYTKDEKIRNTTEYTYNSNNFLCTATIYNQKSIQIASKTWQSNPLTNARLSIYKIIRGEKLTNEYLNISYDEYKQYFTDSNTIADSAKYYTDSKLMFKTIFSYEKKLWCTKEEFFDPENIKIAQGVYSLNKDNFQKKYEFTRIATNKISSCLFDKKNNVLQKEIQVADSNAYKQAYHYNNLNLLTKIQTFSINNYLYRNIEFEYYQPFGFIKKQKISNYKDSLIQFYAYDEFGLITDSLNMATKNTLYAAKQSSDISLELKHNKLSLISRQSNTISIAIYSMKGQMIVKTFTAKLDAGVALCLNPQVHLPPGVYFVKITTGNHVLLKPFNVM